MSHEDITLATALLMSDGAIPASTGRLLVFVGFRQPVIILQVSFRIAFIFLAWVQRSHTGQAYSAAHPVSADVDLFSTFTIPQVEEADLRLCRIRTELVCGVVLRQTV